MATTRGSVSSALLGGALVSAGAALPWMSFFAGLQSFSGLVGLYGRILFASGALAVLFGVTMLLRREGWLRRTTAVLGAMQVLFIAWLLVGLRSTLEHLGMHAMLLARPGPGLFVALAGALLVYVSANSPARRSVAGSSEYAGIARDGDEEILNEAPTS